MLGLFEEELPALACDQWPIPVPRADGVRKLSLGDFGAGASKASGQAPLLLSARSPLPDLPRLIALLPAVCADFTISRARRCTCSGFCSTSLSSLAVLVDHAQFACQSAPPSSTS
jgi:hypothetical protein